MRVDRPIRSLIVLTALLLALAPALAPAPAAADRHDGERHLEDHLGALDFRLVGPYRGGRSTAVSGVPGQPGTYYMGTTGGGVWKTTDYGETWTNVSDLHRDAEDAAAPRPMGLEDVETVVEPSGPVAVSAGEPDGEGGRRGGDAFGTGSIGAVAVAPSDPNVVYVGTGSACIRGNVSPGDGVYKSTDAGDTWRHVGLPEAGQIGRIEVHPKDPDTLWVAALGHAFGPNRERGVYRSTDGGRTWRNVLYVSDEAGAVDLALDPSNPRVLYAAFWQAVRKPWTMESGGPGSGLFKTTDGGDTWVELTEGLPEGTKGRIGVAVSPARPQRVWALVEHRDEGGLYRSDDGGKSFRRINSERDLVQRAWYYTHVHADPQDPETVYVSNVMFWRSDDGGKSFRPIRTPHGDNHALWIDPDDPRILLQANDGGANVSTNGGRTWSTQANQPTAEMYRVSVDDQYPYWLYGGQQDNSAVAIPSRAPGGIDRTDWYSPAGCESAWVAVDPRDPDVTYGGCYGGTIGRYDRGIAEEREVMTYPQMAVGQAAKDLTYRFQWNAPIRVSPHDPSVVYHTSNYVHRSRDEGQSWEVISPDLTRDDESKQGYSGGPITWDNTGVEVYGTIFSFEESPHRPGLLWAGTDDGLVHLSEDDGETWRDITPAGMPEWGTVNHISLSPHEAGRAYLAVHRYRMDDFRPYVFRTDDFGASWKLLTSGTNGIPADHFVRTVAEDPERRGLLFAGTEFGLYASLDDGASWQPFQLDLPVTPITHLVVHRGDLVLSTQGRSFWILDDLTPLRRWSSEIAAADAHLYPPRDTIRYAGGGGWGGGGGARGENPPGGAVVFYQLGEDLSEEGATEVKLEILDSAGEVLRTLSSQEAEPSAPNPFAQFFPGAADAGKIPAEKGLNRYVWNLRLPDPFVVPDNVLWGGANGPEVPPGLYRVRLTVGDWSATEAFEVLPDPRREVAPEAFAARYAFAKEVTAAFERSQRAVEAIRDVRGQVEATARRLDEDGEDSELQDAKKALAEKLTAIEEELTQPKSKAIQDILNFPPKLDNQLLYLQNVTDSIGFRPTDGAVQRLADLEQELDELVGRLHEALSTDLAAYNELVRGRETAPIVVGDWRESDD